MTPMDIVDFMRMEYGINVNYQKVWRARLCALDRICGSTSDSYALLSLFSKAIKEKEKKSQVITYQVVFFIFNRVLFNFEYDMSVCSFDFLVFHCTY